jgi:hypothetical protein
MDLILYRCGSLDMWSEWLASSSWEGQVVVQDSVSPSMRVSLQLRVHGTYQKRRCRPRSWSAQLRVEGVTHNVASGRCRTLREAVRQVEALDLTPHVEAVLRAFYAPERAMCVYSQRGADRWDALAHDGWAPWATSFSGWTDHEMSWPCGEYLVADAGCLRHVRISGWYSSGSSPETRELKGLLPNWCRKAA